MLFKRSCITRCLLFGRIFSGSEFMCRRHSAVIHCRNGHFSKHPDIEATKNELSKEWKITKEKFPTKRESREKTVWMLQIQQRPKKAPEFPTSSSLAKVIWKCVHHQKKDKWLFSSFTQAIAHFYNVRDNFSMSSNQRTSEQRKLLMYRLKTLTWRRGKNRMNNDFLI